MDWITTTARTVEEAQTRALDLLGVDSADAEIQVIEEGKTGLFGRTKSEARVRARIKPKAPPVKEERRSRDGRGGDRNRNRGGNNKGRNRNRGGNNKGAGNNGGGNNKGAKGNGEGNKSGNGQAKGRDGAKADRSNDSAAAASSGNGAGNGKSRSRNRGGNRQRGNDGARNNEDRVEMPIEEQRETLQAFVTGVAESFDSTAKVTLVEEGTTLQAQVTGDDLGRLVGNRAATLQSLEELARTAMHRAAAGRRYHRIQVDVDNYRARRREALSKFARELAESVADSGVSKAMEPMGAADRKLIHDAVAEVDGVETVSEGRDPRRYIVLHPLNASDEEE